MLANKLGITKGRELALVEEKISKKRALEMFKTSFFDTLQAGTYKSLSKIHYSLFKDIYDFAGKVRTVNISKGNFYFVPAMYLERSLQHIEKMSQTTFDEIVEKYIEMNIAHPFRDGNGRSMRIWLDNMLKKELKAAIDWRCISKEDYFLAMKRSPIKDVQLKGLLKAALTDQINDREIYMKGIDVSYYYEGYNNFKMLDLQGKCEFY